MNQDNPIEILKNNGIPVTVQRVKILEMMINSYNHPTAEDIYSALSENLSILSFATIYNTLRLLCKVGIIDEIRIEKDKVHYDFIRRKHNHLLCYNCNKIVDIFNDQEIKDLPKFIDGHKVEKAHIYYYGICCDCQKTRR